MTQQQPPGEGPVTGQWPGPELDPASAREEAERLVAAGLAAVSMAADRIGAPSRERGGAAAVGYDALGDMLFGPSRHRRHSVANDSAACCQCPVCRLISAAREPSPVFAERLATGVGSLAEGAARVLRTVAGPPAPGGATTAAERTTGRTAPAATAAPAASSEPDPWAAATAAAATEAPPATPAAPKPTKATTGKATTGKATTGKATTGKATTGKRTSKAATGKPASSKVATGKPASSKAATGKPATGARAATPAKRTDRSGPEAGAGAGAGAE